MFNRKVVPATMMNPEKDFNCSIKPILICMKFIGVDLNKDGWRQYGLATVFYSLLWLSFNIYLFVATIIASTTQSSFRLPDMETSVNFTTTVSWTAVISDTNYNGNCGNLSYALINQLYFKFWLLFKFQF